jgi:hypothetical protein
VIRLGRALLKAADLAEDDLVDVRREVGMASAATGRWKAALGNLLHALRSGAKLSSKELVTLAEALEKNGKPACAAECLASSWSSASRHSSVLAGKVARLRRQPTCSEDRAVAATFFRPFGGSSGHETLASRVQRARESFHAELFKPRIAADTASSLQVLRGNGSHRPIMKGRGGGYVLSHGGRSCVIDPGYGFIRNFFDAGFGLGDIDAIVVTHGHDDHVADLLAISSLVHKAGFDERSIKLFLNRTSFCSLKDHSELFSGAFSLQPILVPGQRGIPVFAHNGYKLAVDVLRASHKVDIVCARRGSKCASRHGVGVAFTLTSSGRKCSKCVLFTSDTSWNERVESQYRRLHGKIDVAVVHVSSIGNEFGWLFADARPADYIHPQHLGLVGTIRFIEATQPRMVVLGEKSAELNDDWLSLAALIAESCGLPHSSVVAADIGTTISLVD